ncbi:hypothetical protein KC19_6G015900 [Ceratodon purpureus]|uniref:Uncharacterized protein n=1 Tax=Ceratodon purpureus TaxID=3225 RepID=A0A8T0HE10_CERPU|nr:hypothetical protein KC19_6G015900 [Ceratodon purpureus]
MMILFTFWGNIITTIIQMLHAVFVGNHCKRLNEYKGVKSVIITMHQVFQDCDMA